MSVEILSTPLYHVVDAARLLQMPPSTLRYWVEGDRERPPVLRDESTGDSTLTWGEFVEAGLLHEYRIRDVSLQHLRVVISILRDEFGVPYPLAHFRPFVAANRRLVLTAQQRAGLPTEDAIVWQIEDGQLVLRDRVALYLERVDFEEADGPALRIYPWGKDTPILIDPKRSSGSPTIRGVRTEALAELVEAGEPIDQVVEDFGLDPQELRAALAYEWQTAA
ncbi:MAG: DUF433 domain-containing protein [Actinomycetota bacterium]|nr:DUF433 domain-containing protein [Actinomycetota bacterium]